VHGAVWGWEVDSWTRRLEFLALGAPGVGVRAINSLALFLSTRVIVGHDSLLSGNRN
jgi:hypothetical protein